MDRFQFNKTNRFQFNKSNNQWKSLSSLPCPKNHPRVNVIGAAIDSYRMIVVEEQGFIGREPLTLLYDNRKPSEWTCLPSAPKPTPCAAAAIDGMLVIVNESGIQDYSTVNNVHLLDLSTMAWKQLPSTIHKRDKCAVATCGRYLYAFGGFKYHCKPRSGFGYGLTTYPQNTVERLNIDTMEWEDLPTMPTERALCAVSVCGDKIIVAGGTEHAWGTGMDVVEVFDTKSLQWSTAPSMPIKSFGCAAVSVAGRYMVVTGGTERFHDNKSLDITQVYDCRSRYWKVLSNKMKKGRAWHAAALLGGKQLIIAGGGSITSSSHKLCSPKTFDCVESMVLPMDLTIKGQLVVLRWVVQKKISDDGEEEVSSVEWNIVIKRFLRRLVQKRQALCKHESKKDMAIGKPAVKVNLFSMVDSLIYGNDGEDDLSKGNNVIRHLVLGDIPLDIFKIVCSFL